MLRVVASLLSLVLLAACATHSKSVVSRPVIKRIAIIPATDPTWYSFENVSALVYAVPISFYANKLDSRHKAKLFNDKLNSRPPTLAADFTDDVARSLREYGFTVEILQGLPRPAGDLDNVDYDKVTANADAILHLWISEVGLYSPRTSVNYIPRVNASAKLFVKGQDENVYEDEIYYGVDAKKGKAWAIVPDPKFTFPSFDAVMSNLDDVRNAFESGALEISKRMSEQIYNSAK